jgi:hypothetical protein
MRKTSLLSAALLLFAAVPALRADLAAIQPSALPQDASVLAALSDAKQLEPYSAAWTATWNFPVPKDQVATRLGDDLNALAQSAKSNPNNAELQLLAGLVARYAYNVDVSGSFDAATNALAQAEKLAPADYRASWFLSTLQCQSNGMTTGAQGFLNIENSHTWDALPAAFWEDYVVCVLTANMPEHALRAVDYLKQLNTGSQQDFASLAGLAQQRLIPFDPAKTYQPSDVWSAGDPGQDAVFTSTMCGLRLHAQSNWTVNQMAFSNGSCVAYFSTGPYKAVTTSLRPSILVLVQQPQQNQTLQDFSKKYLTTGTFTSDSTLKCPAANCIALKGEQAGAYKADGDGHPRIIFVARDQPQYPGLIFESPAQLPQSNGSQGAQYYHPASTQLRIPGALYYVILLDTASSIEDPAVQDFSFFLQSLTVE